MESHEYQTLFEFESSYWWFRGLHLILLDTFNALGLEDDARVLDAGCGTGQNLLNISQHITPDAYGFDVSIEASRFWARRGLERVCVASINDIPFPDCTFSAVVSVDVLECDLVKEDVAFGEMWRVLRPGGFMILVVPAYQWLMTPEHHKAVGAVRRYSRPKVASLLQNRPMELIRLTHLFASVFPAVAGYRLALRLLPDRSDGVPRSELRPMRPFFNNLLSRIMNAERRLVRKLDLPLGSSIMAVARKVET